MPLRATTVRFAPDAMDYVQQAAAHMGISVAQFIREASIMRALMALDHESARSVRREVDTLRSHVMTQHLARSENG